MADSCLQLFVSLQFDAATDLAVFVVAPLKYKFFLHLPELLLTSHIPQITLLEVIPRYWGVDLLRVFFETATVELLAVNGPTCILGGVVAEGEVVGVGELHF